MAFKCKFCDFFSSESYIAKRKGCKLNLLAPVDATMNWNWIFYSPPSLPPASHPGMNSITLTCALVLSIGVVFNLSLTVVLKYLASLWCTVLGVIEVVLQLGLIVVGGACLPNQGAPQRTAWRLPSICQELESAVPPRLPPPPPPTFPN